MEVFSVLAACVLLIGGPWAAAVYWVSRRVDGVHDRLEQYALGLAGVGAVTWALWAGGRLFGLSTATLVAAPILVSALLVVDARRSSAPSPRPEPTTRPAGAARPVLLMGIVFVLLLAPTFVSFGLSHSGRVHTLAMTDWYKHLTVASAIAGSETFPPPNPFLHADDDPRYYFGFHLLGAAASRLAGGSQDVYPWLLGLTAVVGFSVPLVLYAYARPLGTQRMAVLAAATCFLAGFDLVVLSIDTLRMAWHTWPWPSGLDGVRALVPATHLDYWIHHNERQFNPVFTATAWAPQHVAAVLLALGSLALVAPSRSDPSTPRSGILLPALNLAALPVMSAYVALALALGVAASLLVSTWSGRCPPWRVPAVRRWVPVGVAALLLSLPTLPVLVGGEGSASRLTLGVSASGGWINGALWNTMFGAHWWTNLLDTPAVYLLEFGIVGLLAATEIVRVCRRPVRREETTERVVLMLSMLALVTLVRPPLGEPNNLYARPMLLVWAMAVPFGVQAALGATRVVWLKAAIVVCVAGTGYALAGMVLQGVLFFSVPPALADACAWTMRETPRGSVLAVSPDQYSRYIGFFCRRPLALADARHARLLGASDALFGHTSNAMREAFSADTPAEAATRLDDLGVDAVLVRRGISGGGPQWLGPPCFSAAYRNDLWVVGIRTPVGCP